MFILNGNGDTTIKRLLLLCSTNLSKLKCHISAHIKDIANFFSGFISPE